MAPKYSTASRRRGENGEKETSSEKFPKGRQARERELETEKKKGESEKNKDKGFFETIREGEGPWVNLQSSKGGSSIDRQLDGDFLRKPQQSSVLILADKEERSRNLCSSGNQPSLHYPVNYEDKGKWKKEGQNRSSQYP